MVIVRTDSRNVAFKVSTMRDSITVGQHEFIMRRTNSNGFGSEEENKKALGDITYNADLSLSLTRKRLIRWSRRMFISA